MGACLPTPTPTLTPLIQADTKLYCLVSRGVYPVVSPVFPHYFAFTDILLSICYQRIAIIKVINLHDSLLQAVVKSRHPHGLYISISSQV